MRQSSGTAFFRSFSETLARAFRWQRAGTTRASVKMPTSVDRQPLGKMVLTAPRLWLSELPWEKVQSLNHSQCQLQNTQPVPNQAAYEAVRQAWEAAHKQPMSLMKALELCKESQDKGPFMFSNSSTFCLAAKTMLEELVKALPPVEGHILGSTTANYVAGRVGKRELLQVLRMYESKWSRLLTNVSSNGHAEKRPDA